MPWALGLSKGYLPRRHTSAPVSARDVVPNLAGQPSGPFGTDVPRRGSEAERDQTRGNVLGEQVGATRMLQVDRGLLTRREGAVGDGAIRHLVVVARLH